MQIVIDIPDRIYKIVQNRTLNITDDEILENALKNGTPLPKGQWINIEDRTDWYDTSYKCSCCGREIITPYDFKNNLYSDYPYCHCGARMVGSQESEE